jgi:hypothetical protein
MDMSRRIDEIATQILQQYAKENGTTLYKMGIIDQRRRYMINKREISMSRLEKKRDSE